MPRRAARGGALLSCARQGGAKRGFAVQCVAARCVAGRLKAPVVVLPRFDSAGRRSRKGHRAACRRAAMNRFARLRIEWRCALRCGNPWVLQRESTMRISVTISGVTPLLMNRFGETAEVAVGSGTRPTFSGTKGTPREQAEPKLYAETDGALYVPGANIFAAIIAAGIFHKVGKKQLTTAKSSLIPAGCIIEDLVCPLGTKKWEVDSRSVVNPSTQGRMMCHRPRLDKWEVTFTLDVDDTVFDPKLIRQVVDDAGKKIGLGDFRPQRKGPFGRFVVTKWAEIKVAKIA